MAEVTVYADVDAFIESWSLTEYAGSYADARQGTPGAAFLTARTNYTDSRGKKSLAIGQLALNGPPADNWYCNEGVLSFNTAGVVPAGNMVTGAVLSLAASILPSAWAGTTVLEARAHTFTEPPSTAAFVPASQLASKTLLASAEIPPSSGGGAGTPDTYIAFTSEAGFAGAINNAGRTQLVIVSLRQRTGDEPATGTVEDWLVAYSAEEAEAGEYRPRLVITYAPYVVVSGQPAGATAVALLAAITALNLGHPHPVIPAPGIRLERKLAAPRVHANRPGMIR